MRNLDKEDSPLTTLTNMNTKYANFLVRCAFAQFVVGSLYAEPVSQKDQSLAVFLISSSEMTGSGFACLYKGREFVATNLHVLDGDPPVTVKSQAGDDIALSGNMVAAADADICLLAVVGKFADKGITPFEFDENAFKNTKVGDEVVCLGNSLGNGVITETKGKILAYGQPRLEIDCPIVKGNSGGPVVHRASGKVIGLVTEAIINKLNFDELGVAASKSKNSPIHAISYFAHRIDTAKIWSGTTVVDYLKIGKTISAAGTGLSRATLFLAAKAGWEEDQRLSDAWKDYQKFIDQAKGKSSASVKVTNYVNSYGVVVRRDVRVRSMSVSEADYDKAYDKFKRAVEWKILADQETLKKAKVIGFRQMEGQKLALGFSTQVLALQKEL